MATTEYTPDRSLNAETRAAYRSFYRKTGLVPAPRWWPDRAREAHEQWKADPANLSDTQIADIACVFPDDAEKAWEAREAARHPKPAAPPQADRTPERTSRPIVQVSQEQAEAMVTLAVKKAGAVTYDGKRFSEAHGRFYGGDATLLTDRDIALFALVDPNLAATACAKRAGHVETSTADEQAALRKHVTFAFLKEWITEYLHPLLSTYRFHLNATSGRVEALEKAMRPTGVATLPDGQGGTIEAVEMHVGRDGSLTGYPQTLVTKDAVDHMARRVVDLEQRIAELEARPSLEWQGVWTREQTYRKGHCVTWSGSVWTCVSAISRGETPGTPSAPSRNWKLIVCRGKDGRDGKDYIR
jgi:hypothetical protein